MPHPLRREQDQLSWLRLNWVIVSAVVGTILSGAVAFIHLEDHVGELQRQVQESHDTFQREIDDKQQQIIRMQADVDHNRDRLDYQFGKQ